MAPPLPRAKHIKIAHKSPRACHLNLRLDDPPNLLSIAPELRLLIYDVVFLRDVFVVGRGSSLFVPGGLGKPIHYKNPEHDTLELYNFPALVVEGRVVHLRHCTSLLLTCKQIYGEGRQVLARNGIIFSFFSRAFQRYARNLRHLKETFISTHLTRLHYSIESARPNVLDHVEDIGKEFPCIYDLKLGLQRGWRYPSGFDDFVEESLEIFAGWHHLRLFEVWRHANTASTNIAQQSKGHVRLQLSLCVAFGGLKADGGDRIWESEVNQAIQELRSLGTFSGPANSVAMSNLLMSTLAHSQHASSTISSSPIESEDGEEDQPLGYDADDAHLEFGAQTPAVDDTTDNDLSGDDIGHEGHHG